jgi:hypothetical protein
MLSNAVLSYTGYLDENCKSVRVIYYREKASFWNVKKKYHA